jgi:hypothetical protein
MMDPEVPGMETVAVVLEMYQVGGAMAFGGETVVHLAESIR